MMLHKKALQLSGFLARRGIFDPEDAEVYAYGLELLFSTAISIILVIIVSILFLKPLAWVFILLPFIPLRVTAGGYHAKTHFSCIFMFTVAFAALMALSVLTTGLVTPWMLTGVSAACFSLVLLLSPVASKNKPLSDEERRKNRRKSIILSAAALLAVSVSFFTGAGLLIFFTYLVMGQLGAAILLVVAKVVGD